jgi:hypothetical protein
MKAVKAVLGFLLKAGVILFLVMAAVIFIGIAYNSHSYHMKHFDHHGDEDCVNALNNTGDRAYIERQARMGMYTKEQLTLEKVFYWHDDGMQIAFSSYDNQPIVVVDRMEPGFVPYSTFKVVYALQKGKTLYYGFSFEVKPLNRVNISTLENGTKEMAILCEGCASTKFAPIKEVKSSKHYRARMITDFEVKKAYELSSIPDGEYEVQMFFLDMNNGVTYLWDMQKTLGEISRLSQDDYWRGAGKMMARDIKAWFTLKSGDNIIVRVNSYSVDQNHHRFIGVPEVKEYFKKQRKVK